METLFITLFLFLLPFGELLRYQAGSIAINAIDIVALVAIIFVIGKTIKDKNYIKLTLTKPILFFFFAGLLSLLINCKTVVFSDLLVSSLYLFRWIAFTSFYVIAAHLPKEKKERLPYFLMVSGFATVVLGLLQFFLYPDLRNLRYIGWDEHYLRIFGTFFDPNFIGILFVFTFIISFYLLFQAIRKKSMKLIATTGIISLITCIAIFLTYSRGAYLSLLTALCGIIFAIGYKKIFPFVLAILGLFILFVIFMTNTPTEAAHLLRIPSSLARVASAEQAIAIFQQHPLFGVGFDTYRYVSHQQGYIKGQSWDTSHAGAGVDNSYLFVLVTTGIVGFFVYLYLLFTMIQKCIKNHRNVFSLFVLASLCSLLVGSMFINALFYPVLLTWIWILFGIIEHNLP